LRTGFLAGRFAAFRALLRFGFFAMPSFYHGAPVCASMTRLIALAFVTLAVWEPRQR